MDELTLAMSNSTTIDTKDRLLVALLRYLLSIIDSEDTNEDYNERYQRRYGPKINSSRIFAMMK